MSHALSEVCTLSDHEDRVWCISWRPNRSPPEFATCGADRVIRIWGAKRGAPLDAGDSWRLKCEIDATEQHGRTLRSIAWNKAGDMFSAACFDATSSLWKEVTLKDEDSPNGMEFERVGLVTGHENEVKCSAYSPSGSYFATCSRDKSVWIYETDPSHEYDCVGLLQSHSQDVKSVQWHPTQDVLFSCSYDDTIKVWGPDGDDWSCKETLSAHTSTVWDLSFDRAGARFVSCSDDRTLRVWRPEGGGGGGPTMGLSTMSYVMPLFRGGLTPGLQQAAQNAALHAPEHADCGWQVASTIQGQHDGPIYSVDWCKHDAGGSCVSIATACGDNFVRVFQPSQAGALEGWVCVASVEAHEMDCNAVAWCPTPVSDDISLLASCGDDGLVRIWRFASF